MYLFISCFVFISEFSSSLLFIQVVMYSSLGLSVLVTSVFSLLDFLNCTFIVARERVWSVGMSALGCLAWFYCSFVSYIDNYVINLVSHDVSAGDFNVHSILGGNLKMLFIILYWFPLQNCINLSFRIQLPNTPTPSNLGVEVSKNCFGFAFLWLE